MINIESIWNYFVENKGWLPGVIATVVMGLLALKFGGNIIRKKNKTVIKISDSEVKNSEFDNGKYTFNDNSQYIKGETININNDFRKKGDEGD